MVLISLDTLNKNHKSKIDPKEGDYGVLRLSDCKRVEELNLNSLVSYCCLFYIWLFT